MGKIAALVDLIKRNVETLDRLQRDRASEALAEDYVLLNAVLHMLQTSTQALIDLGAHVLAELGGPIPKRYAEIPKALQELGILSREKAEFMRRAIGFRNVVVHGYAGISLEIVKSILRAKSYRELYSIALIIAKYAAERGIDP